MNQIALRRDQMARANRARRDGNNILNVQGSGLRPALQRVDHNRADIDLV